MLKTNNTAAAAIEPVPDDFGDGDNQRPQVPATDDNVTFVFVYGTLLQGEPNYQNILHPLKPIDEATIFGNLINLGDFPGAINLDDSLNDIIGEIYAVDAATLARLDRLEGYSPDRLREDCMYVRRPVQAFELHSGTDIPYVVHTYEYVQRGRDYANSIIASGSWREHIQSRKGIR